MNVAAIANCNTLYPNSAEGTLPVMLENEKDNFEKTKILSKSTIDQINCLHEQVLNIVVPPLPENFKLEKYPDTYFVPTEYCINCNMQDCTCPNSDQNSLNCEALGCSFSTLNEQNFKSHQLLVHQIGLPKRKWDEVSGLEPYYERLSKKRFSKILPPNTDSKFTKRQKNIEPVLLDFLKSPKLKSYLNTS